MILSQYTFDYGEYSIYSNDKHVSSFEDDYWNKHEGVKYELLALKEIDAISEKDGSIIIPIDLIYDSLQRKSSNVAIGKDDDELLLSESVRRFLKIPQIGNGVLELKSIGAFRSRGFRIIKSYSYGHNQSDPATSPRVEIDDVTSILLSQNQNTACRLISEHESRITEQEDNFRLGAKLKRLCDEGDIKIVGGRLIYEEVEDVSSIRPRLITAVDGGIDIGLDIESGNNEEFEDLVRSTPPHQEILTRIDSGTQRKRYVLSDDAKKAISSFRRKSHYSKDEKHLLLDNPNECLEGFNLDDYGDRVVGYGVLYAPKINVFKDEDGTEWIDLELMPITPDVEGSDEEPSNGIPVNDKKVMEKMRELIQEAEENGEESICYEGKDIIITDELKKIVSKKSRDGQPLGLITKSNIDTITYKESSALHIKPPHDYSVEMSELFSDQYQLKDYQKYGYGWLDWVKANKSLNGCLLADDMGMGKTIQISAMLAKLKSQDLLRPSLLIVPPILLDEWEKELSKFVPSISFNVIRGKMADDDIEDVKLWDVNAISYQTHLKNQKYLGKVRFSVIICDEVQFIKNPASARTQAVLAMDGDFKIASTATPIENSISELWSILDYSNPGYLPPLREFNKKYGNRKADDSEYERNIADLKEVLSPIVLRRTKDEHLKDELPKKEEKPRLCMIDDRQVQLCKKIIAAFKSDQTISNFLHFFQLIVMALTNPELMEGAYDVVFPTDYVSPKLLETLKLLKDVKERNEKVLIFADRRAVQYKLKNAIEAEYGITVNIINGDTPAGQRKKYTASFGPDGERPSEFEVLVLSPKCAGFGLNLIQANHVIHYLRSFNPAVENQATDRVYRIGQTRPVKVYRLVTHTDDENLKSTVEQKLDEMLERKKELLKDYLYASRAGRVSEEELARELGYKNTGMSLAEVDNLDPTQFEVFTGVLYETMGYQTSLTPLQDYGADCIAIGNEDNVLIQCKKKLRNIKSRVGNSAVQEIVAAKAQYEKQMQIEFKKLVVITNGYYTDAATTQAFSNNVLLIDRDKLSELLDQYHVSRSTLEEAMQNSVPLP